MDWSHHPALLRALQQPELPRYATLATALQGLILAGELLPGDRLPPERALAAALGLSRSTIVASYGRLAEAGWVTARQGQGTTVAAGAPGHVSARKRRVPIGNPALRGPVGDGPWIDFGLATAVPELAWLQPSEAASALVLRESAYQPQGLLALRDRLAARYTARGLPTTPEQILVCAGAQQALALVAQHYLAPGDCVLIEDPNYFGALDLFRAAGARLLGEAVRPGGAHAARLAQRLQAEAPQLVFVCPTLHNPTGWGWTPTAGERFARAARRAGSSLVLVDDSLAELRFDAAPPPFTASGHNIVHVGSLSKSLWAGLRIGWLRAEAPVIETLKRAKANADIACSALSSAIACDLLDRLEALVTPRRAQLELQGRLLREALAAALPEWPCAVPEGGLFLWPAMPTAQAEPLVQAAEALRLRLTAGPALAVEPGAAANRLRLAFTQPPALLQAGVARLAQAYASLEVATPQSTRPSRR